MRYLPLTDSDRETIRHCLGIRETSELFADIPAAHRYPSQKDIPEALSENKLLEKFRQLAAANTHESYSSFLGAGAYRHFIPEVVNHLSAKSEFLTPYTPYQPEVSQGSLQAIFEYQTMIAQLTGMDISNASLYDGGTAAAEAVLLIQRKSRRNRVLVAESLHPEYLEIIKTYIQNLDMEIELVPMEPESGTVDIAALKDLMDENCGGFLFQSPNFFGLVEDSAAISETVHSFKAYSAQVVAEAISLAYLTPPGETGVDIVAGEAQSMGLPLGYGGPYLGFMATGAQFLRQLPGRIVGETKDVDGKRGYVLTLSTREQHIKREKATSNICTNQAWCAVHAAIYMAVMGREGIMKIARTNHLNTAYFVSRISRIKGAQIVFNKNFFNEVVLRIENSDVETLLSALEKKGIIAGIPLKWFHEKFADCLLVNCTEMHGKEEIDRLVEAIGGIQ